jgi:serine/threonine protein phosphatase PrpC
MPWVSDLEGQSLGGNDLVKLVQLVRQALWGPEGNRPEIRVEGTDENGLLSIAIVSGDVAYRVHAPDVQALVALAGPRRQTPRELGPDRLPYVPRTGPTLEVREASLNHEPLSYVLAGPTAQEVDAIHGTRGRAFAGAAYTSRGPTRERQGTEYKAFNEDAVVLRARSRVGTDVEELIAVGAFDQAGGEGAVEDSHGAASAAAATSFDEAVARIEAGVDPAQALSEATQRAGDRVRALGVGAMTTFAGAVIMGRKTPSGVQAEAYIATVGDSRALLVSHDGTVKERTKLHNLGSAICSGQVTDVPKELALQFAGVLLRGVGGDDDSPEIYRWLLEPGDFLIVGTDGLGDARELEDHPVGVWHADRCADDMGKLMAHVSSPGHAVAVLAGYALDQMADQHGKPDNLGISVAQVLRPAAAAR